jgi:hypothetical protein
LKVIYLQNNKKVISFCSNENCYILNELLLENKKIEIINLEGIFLYHFIKKKKKGKKKQKIKPIKRYKSNR